MIAVEHSAGFTPFPRVKSALKGRRFCNATDIIKNFTKKLKILSKYAFQERFQQLYSHRQKCIDAQGDYFEENVA
jgi:hypothetical protein